MSYHLTNEWRKSAAFMIDNVDLLSAFNQNPDNFKDGVVLDLGAGSRLRSKFYKDAEIIVIEPLADKYMKEIEWCDLKDASRVYSRPAEEMVEEIEGTVDFILCINVLDHTYDPRKILLNARRYLKPDGKMLLSVDCYWKSNKLHPVHFSRGKIDKMARETGFGILKAYIGKPFPRCYGLGEVYTLYLTAADDPESVKLQCLTAFGEDARYQRFLVTLLKVMTPYKIVRNLYVRAINKFKRILKSKGILP